MQIDREVFVSNVGTDAWQPDPEVGGELHVLADTDGAYAGMSRFTDTPVVGPWELPERETLVVLEGAARIEIEGGPTVELEVGGMASLPKGAVATWHLTLPYKELWFFPRPLE
jgi:uncharacterized cupin superfamily protein